MGVWLRSAAFALVLLSSVSATATDVVISGKKLGLTASQTRPAGRRFAFVSRDAGVASPFANPATGAHLVVNASSKPGHCYAEIPLDPTKWKAIGGNGSIRGYRYRADAPGTQGIRRIVIRPGYIKISGRGSGWPCDLSAASLSTPVTVTLRIGSDRYCAAFGGLTKENVTGTFRAHDASAPSACPKQDVTMADLNILHGIFCPAPDFCRMADRVDLLFQWIVASGCPDIVTFQEVVNRPSLATVLPLIDAHRLTACPFPYERAYPDHPNTVDGELVLSRYPVVSIESTQLLLNFRRVLFVRIDHPLGPIDVFTTHLSSSSDFAENPCDPDCPPECVMAGAATVRECQAVQVADVVASRHDVTLPAVLAGDFNESPGSFVYNHLVGRGWTDTYLAAGNPECEPLTGIGCTSGRQDEDLSDLESPASNEIERIDYIFLIPPTSPICSATLDPIADLDGDVTSTRIFADDPNPFAPTCGPAPDPICWPSDHEGAELDLNCG